MKKTLITLAALAAAVAYGDTDDSFTITTGAAGAGTGNGTYSGWIANLSGSYLSSSETLAEQVMLSQISIATGTGSSTASGKLVIFTFSTIDTQGTWVATSTNTATFVENSALVFTFDNVVLDTDSNYRFAFVSASAADKKGPFDGVGISMRVQDISTPGVTQGTKSGNAGEYAVNASGALVQYLPNATYTVTNIPEPATATLSLLALAGLAARRRRK